MAVSLKSIRGRLLLVSLLLLLALLAAAVYTQSAVDSARQRTEQRVAAQAELARGIGEVKSSLYEVEVGLYQYAVLLDAARGEHVEQGLHSSAVRIEALRRRAAGDADEATATLVTRLYESFGALDGQARQLLTVIADVDRRFPATPLINRHTYPANLRFITAVESALGESEYLTHTAQQDEVATLLQRLRYQWAQQISIVRVYIANRSGVFGMPEAGMRHHLENRANYLQQIAAGLDELEARAAQGGLGLLQAEAVQTMRSAFEEFETHFAEVAGIYQSGRWREDIRLLRERIQPMFAELWRLVNLLDARFAMASADSVGQVLGTADTLSRAHWFVTGFAALVFLIGLLAFEAMIRRPVYRVVEALEALRRGESFSPLLHSRAEEIDRLVSAFREMQQAVYNREMRLAAIFDNASEGIITINSRGIVEKFNNAAESLFGYHADEVIGSNVSRLMPPPVRDEHDQYIARYLQAGERRVIGSEVNVNALRKDGSIVPVSIKVSEMRLDGEAYFTAIVSDISEHKAMLDHLRHMAEHDSLTGLYNRQYFTDELERVVQRSLRLGGIDCALLYLDLDNFKYVNDTLGHLAGDRVLVEIANLLTRHTRRSDIVARLGGDEFAILLYDVDRDSAIAAAEACRQQVVDYHFRHEGRVIDIGCSIGVALFEPDLESKEDLMARADVSCHTAKRAGRNCVHAYQADDRADMDRMSVDMSWARTIKQAIENDGFVFALQPIVDIHSCRVVSYEALLRMRDGEEGVIMPAGFIPSAERFGLIIDIDRWVVAHALARFDRLMAGREGAHLSINLSAMAIGDPEILRLVTEAVDRGAVDPRRICFEITETIAVANLEAAAAFLERLRECGYRTALDDFGIGYCSFAYLKDLPVDYVKIDGSFVRDIGADPIQRAMVKSMNEIAHAMGKLTVAEYVESARVMDMLREIGVDRVQGHYTGRPQLVGAPPRAAPVPSGVAD